LAHLTDGLFIFTKKTPMFIPFDNMKDSSRLWVYQSSRFLNDDETEWLSHALSSFLDGWKAHGQPLVCSFRIEENLFIMLAVDEDAYGASGCSIDASVHALQSMQQTLSVDFFTRDTVAFSGDKGLELVKLTDLKNRVHEGEIYPEKLMYNTLITRKFELNSQWIVPAKGTWVNRYFKTANTLQ